jgi:hypothetical protein
MGFWAVGGLMELTPPTLPNRIELPQSRPAGVVAYAAAHRDWIAEHGRLPTHDEAKGLRASYRIGETSAAEWAIIREYIAPAAKQLQTVEALSDVPPQVPCVKRPPAPRTVRGH